MQTSHSQTERHHADHVAMHHFVLQASPNRNPHGRELVLAIDIFYILSGYPWPSIAGVVGDWCMVVRWGKFVLRQFAEFASFVIVWWLLLLMTCLSIFFFRLLQVGCFFFFIACCLPVNPWFVEYLMAHSVDPCSGWCVCVWCCELLLVSCVI